MTKKMLKGKIVLVYFPFTDLTGRKLRPALVLHEGKVDVIVAFISSRTEKYEPETDVLIEKDHPEFKNTGLKKESVIKLTKIATIHKKLIAGEIGEAGKIIRNEVNEKIRRTLFI